MGESTISQMIFIYSILILLSHFMFNMVLGTIIETNKQINPTILVLLTMNEKGGVIYKLCRSCEY